MVHTTHFALYTVVYGVDCSVLTSIRCQQLIQGCVSQTAISAIYLSPLFQSFFSSLYSSHLFKSCILAIYFQACVPAIFLRPVFKPFISMPVFQPYFPAMFFSHVFQSFSRSICFNPVFQFSIPALYVSPGSHPWSCAYISGYSYIEPLNVFGNLVFFL